VGPILAAAAAHHGLPVAMLIACAKAESDMTAAAFRNGPWPDVSVGPFQQTIEFASGFGVGTGQNTPENIALCRAELADWKAAADVAGRNLSGCLQRAKAFDPAATLDRLCLITLSTYNSGSPKDETTAWWDTFQRHRYQDGLVFAHRLLG